MKGLKIMKKVYPVRIYSSSNNSRYLQVWRWMSDSETNLRTLRLKSDKTTIQKQVRDSDHVTFGAAILKLFLENAICIV
jgi:hypothetical protein